MDSSDELEVCACEGSNLQREPRGKVFAGRGVKLIVPVCHHCKEIGFVHGLVGSVVGYACCPECISLTIVKDFGPGVNGSQVYAIAI